jgi:hypothetical protein
MKPDNETILKARKAKADYIMAHPGRFGVCEGCESVIDFSHGCRFCPACYGYHFNFDRTRLTEVATRLGSTLPHERAVDYEEN